MGKKKTTDWIGRNWKFLLSLPPYTSLCHVKMICRQAVQYKAQLNALYGCPNRNIEEFKIKILVGPHSLYFFQRETDEYNCKKLHYEEKMKLLAFASWMERAATFTRCKYLWRYMLTKMVEGIYSLISYFLLHAFFQLSKSSSTSSNIPSWELSKNRRQPVNEMKERKKLFLARKKSRGDFQAKKKYWELWILKIWSGFWYAWL